MYAEVVWQMKRPYNTLFVPATAVVSANDKTFVIRVKSGKVDTVPISRGQTMGKEVEVVGDLQPGDQVVFQASEDIKPGSTVHTKLISQHEASKSDGHGEE
jgi:membrane fusion protein, multidrug efflux system